MKPRLLTLVLTLLGLLACAPALAEISPGQVALRDLPAGALELRAVPVGLQGSFRLQNTGTKPAQIRLRVLGSEQDVRAPSGLAVLGPGRGSAFRLEGGATQLVQVTFAPQSSRARQVFADVVIDVEGAPALYVAVRGDVAAGPFAKLRAHLLSLLLGLPILGALGIGALHLLGRKDDRIIWPLAVGVTGGDLLVAAFLFLRFDPGMGRSDGNEGMQFIERAVLSRGAGVEYALGLDGASMPLALTAALLGFLGVLAGRGVELRRKAFFSLLLLAEAAFFGVFAALDMALFVFFWVAALAALVKICRRTGAFLVEGHQDGRDAGVDHEHPPGPREVWVVVLFSSRYGE